MSGGRSHESIDISEHQLDRANQLSRFRHRFSIPGDRVYFDGNSLGPLSTDAEKMVRTALDQWKSLGIDGWLNADPDWFTLGERLGARMAPLVGAEPDEVVATGTTTINLHALVSSFYKPTDSRRKILATSLDFPSDVYALKNQITLQGGEPENDLVLVESRDGRIVEERDLINAMTPDVALCVFPSVLYRSGQLLDIEQLSEAGRERGIPVGFDCAHSIGSIPHQFDTWGVDFAFWCTYKYLNAGPGSMGALYVNRKHFGLEPALSGWWGYEKDRQFEMSHDWQGAPGTGAWQISTVNVLSGAALLGSLQVLEEAGIETIRAESLQMTDYLIELVEKDLTASPYHFAVGTPRDRNRRGGHVAVEHAHARSIALALRRRGIIPDFRPPNVIRLAPIPLYNTYEEIDQTVGVLKDIVESGEYLSDSLVDAPVS